MTTGVPSKLKMEVPLGKEVINAGQHDTTSAYETYRPTIVNSLNPRSELKLLVERCILYRQKTPLFSRSLRGSQTTHAETAQAEAQQPQPSEC